MENRELKRQIILRQCLHEDTAISLYKKVRRIISIPKTSFYYLLDELGQEGLLKLQRFGRELWVEPTESGIIHAIQRMEGIEYTKILKSGREVSWILTKCPPMTPIVSLASYPPFYPAEENNHYYTEPPISDGTILYKALLKMLNIDGRLFKPSSNLNATWFIAQDGIGWWGFGTLNFLKAIINSEQRYREVEKQKLHHTEVYMYVARLSDNAIVSISGEMDAGTGRVRTARLTVITNGIFYRLPVLDELLQIYGNDIPVGFQKYQDFDMRQRIVFRVVPDERQEINVEKEAEVQGIVAGKPSTKGFVAKNILHRFEDQFKKNVRDKVLQLEKTFYYVLSQPPKNAVKYRLKEVNTFYIPRGGLVLHIIADWFMK